MNMLIFVPCGVAIGYGMRWCGINRPGCRCCNLLLAHSMKPDASRMTIVVGNFSCKVQLYVRENIELKLKFDTYESDQEYSRLQIRRQVNCKRNAMLHSAPGEKCRVGSCTSDACYECPRCAAKYCSVPCYRRHSELCVTAFAEEADQRLRGVNVSDLEKKLTNKKLRAALEQLEENNPLIERSLPETLLNLTVTTESSSSEESGDKSGSDEIEENWKGFAEHITAGNAPFNDNDQPEDIADVLGSLVEEMEEANPSFDDVIGRLPKHMVDEFYEMVNDGRIGRFLPVWRPWWLQDTVVEEGIVENPSSSALPPKPEKVNLTVPIVIAHRKASPNILFSAVDVVYGYCLMMRVHNGDWQADCTAAARFLWEVCAVLAEDSRHGSIEDALSSCLKKGQAATGVKGAAIEAIADTSAIVGGRKDWLSRALWEVYKLFEQAKDAYKGRRAREIAKRKLKVGFLVSWCLGTDDEVFVNTSRLISSFLTQEQETREQLDIARRALELAEQGGNAEMNEIRLP